MKNRAKSQNLILLSQQRKKTCWRAENIRFSEALAEGNCLSAEIVGYFSWPQWWRLLSKPSGLRDHDVDLRWSCSRSPCQKVWRNPNGFKVQWAAGGLALWFHCCHVSQDVNLVHLIACVQYAFRKCLESGGPLKNKAQPTWSYPFAQCPFLGYTTGWTSWPFGTSSTLFHLVWADSKQVQKSLKSRHVLIIIYNHYFSCN